MKLRVAGLVTVWACVVAVTCVVAAPEGESGSSSEDSELLDDTYRKALMLDNWMNGLWGPADVAFVDEVPMDNSDLDEDSDTFARRRRMLTGSHARYPGSGRRFRNRPRVFVPRRRLGRRPGSRNNVSPY